MTGFGLQMTADGLAEEGVFRADTLEQGFKQFCCSTYEETSQHYQYTESRMHEHDTGTLQVGINHTKHSFKPVPIRARFA